MFFSNGKSHHSGVPLFLDICGGFLKWVAPTQGPLGIPPQDGCRYSPPEGSVFTSYLGLLGSRWYQNFWNRPIFLDHFRARFQGIWSPSSMALNGTVALFEGDYVI